MRTLRKGGIFLVLVVFVLLATQATGAQDAEAPAPETPTVEEIAEDMMRTLLGLKVLRTEGQLSAITPGQPQSPLRALPVTHMFAWGPRIVMLSPMGQLYLDDEKLTAYLPMLNQYMVEKYSTRDAGGDTPGRQEMPDWLMSPEKAGEPEELARSYVAALDGPAVSGDAAIHGEDSWVVEASVSLPVPETDGLVIPVTVWHRKSDALPAQISIDPSALTQHVAEQMPPDQALPLPTELRIVLSFSKIEIDPDLPESAFTFQPPADARKVEEFGPGPGASAGPQPSELSGKPAPDFTAETLDGEEITLSELKGKAVVLDFWASWCGPCMMELPHIQEFWTEVKDRDVVVLGINGDSDESDARGAVGDKGLTFPIIHDRDDAISDAYGVSAIPCLVLIGPDGKVIGRHVGFDPDIKEVLRKDVEQALKGEEEEPAATGEAGLKPPGGRRWPTAPPGRYPPGRGHRDRTAPGSAR
jgi:peroxiredoxin